jgi:hypothetical protein
MPRSVYEQLKNLPLTLHVTLALTQAKKASVTEIALPREDFSVPGFGVCAPLTGFFNPFSQATGLICRSALRDPPLTYIGVLWSDAPCNPAFPKPDPGVQGAGWAGSLDRAPADPNFSPVQQVKFDLSNGYKNERNGQSRYLCPGSPVSFTQFERVSRTQAGITISDFHLPDVTFSNGEVHVVYSNKTTTVTGQKQ